MFSNLDLVKACDSFPYDGSITPIYHVYLPNDTRPHGYMLPEIVSLMPWTDAFAIDHQTHTVKLNAPSNSNGEAVDLSSHSTTAFATLINKAIDQDIFSLLHGSHSEIYPILGAKEPVHFERFAGDLFGFVARGAHLTIYTNHPESGMKIWVPRRSTKLFTYPGKLDTTVAGGVPAHQTPFENIISEADEEASLTAELVKQLAKPVGALTYMSFSTDANNSTEKVVASDVVYVYDMEVEADIVPVPKDEEVKEFYLMSVEEVQAALGKGEFKTNSAVVMIDFFIRHGIITAENEGDYVEILTRMHRRLPLPVTASQKID